MVKTSKNKIVSSKKKTNKNKCVGGKMLASGGFGCVFQPALKCYGATEREKNKVSKLMTIKHANAEYNEITKMNNQLKSIPNYQDYFLVDNFSLCKPAKLSKEDLENFENCEALSVPSKQTSSKPITNTTHLTIHNVNENLRELKILNMPFGGIPIDDYVKNNLKTFHQLNSKLIQLLKNGIIPLNKNHIYHNDIKDSNVLVHFDVSTQSIKTKLIDWGLSCTYKPNDKLPKPWKNRPLQFNVPFSVILFTDLFVASYTKFSTAATNEKNIPSFVRTYFKAWKKKRGKGHLSYITYMFKLIELESETKTYIINYLSEIVSTFLENKMTLTDYLNNVFIKIIDIWGFITLYVPLLEILYNNLQNLIEVEKETYQILKNILLTFLFQPRITEININDLVKKLEQLKIL
jgi:serine/threonine protein kinase